MICKCGGLLCTECVYDDPQTGYAYNLMQCNDCGMLCKEDVWKNKGLTWISEDGKIVIERSKIEISTVVLPLDWLKKLFFILGCSKVDTSLPNMLTAEYPKFKEELEKDIQSILIERT